MKPLTTTCVAALMIAIAAPMVAASDVDADTVPDRSGVEDIIDEISTGLTEVYIFADVAADMVALLESERAAGAYGGLSYSELADVLTRDLRSVSHDRHLGVRFDLTALDPPPDDGPDEEDASRQRWVTRLAEGNFGIQQVRMLDGNVGYLELSGFAPAEIGGDAAVAAMGFLARSRALIFDLRSNGGGDPSMIQLISSYLFTEPVHLNSFYIRESDQTQQFWTHAHVDGQRLADVPVFVLTSSRTFSAAEEFTYNLKHLERATVIGETTGGGAHPVRPRRIDGHPLSMSLPYGRAVNPITGTNWEGTGVTPHHEVDAQTALEVAHVMALEQLAASEDLDEWVRPRIEWALVERRAAANPVELAQEVAAQYVGRYGPRAIRIENGNLVYQREGRATHVLRPLDVDLFSLEDLDFFRVRFERDEGGDVIAIVGLYSNGTTDQNRRNDS